MKKLVFLITSLFLATSIYGYQKGGLKILRVASSSMEPTIKRGALVLIKRENKYTTGDIISYKTGSESSIITHRVVKISKIGSSYFFTTKGDGNEFEDPSPVSPNEVVGKLIFTVPFIDFFYQKEKLTKIFFISFLNLEGIILGNLFKKSLGAKA